MDGNAYPNSLHIEASSRCQLACPVCPTASGATRPVLGSGYLSVLDFEQLLDQHSDITDVELSNYGEMFLNPQLPELLRVAFERKVVLHADGGVNLNHANEEALEGLVRYKFRSMTCSIDGATQEVYKLYRIRGDLDRVIGHIRKINEYKRKYRSGLPMLAWQFVIFGHNEEEIERAREMASDLKMRFYVKLNWDAGFSQIRNPQFVRSITGLSAVNRSEFARENGVDYARRICHQLWRSPVVNWDGKLLGCCRNFWGDFGLNVFQHGLIDSISGEKMEYAKRMLMGGAGPREDIPCVKCDLFQAMSRNGRWVTEAELRDALAPGDIMVSILLLERSSRGKRINVYLLPGPVLPTLGVLRTLDPDAILSAGQEQCTMGASEAGEYVICLLEDQEPGRDLPDAEMQCVPIRIDARPVCQEFAIGLDGVQRK